MSQDIGQIRGLNRLDDVLKSGRTAIFGKTDAAEPPSAQSFAPVPVMPVASSDDAAMQAAKKKSLADQIARRGRASTILTNDSGEKLGG